MLVKNKTSYDTKVPTNVRLVNEIKKKVLAEAKARHITMADVINEILINHYNDGGM